MIRLVEKDIITSLLANKIYGCYRSDIPKSKYDIRITPSRVIFMKNILSAYDFILLYFINVDLNKFKSNLDN